MTNMFRVRTVWNGVAGAPFYSNHYWTSDGTPETAQACVDAVDTFWSALTGNIVLALNYEVEGLVAEISDSTGDLVGAIDVNSQAGAGTFDGDQIPRQIQALVKWSTGVVVSGRFLKGRTFIPGLGETLNAAGGRPTSSIITLVTAAALSLIGDNDPELRIWSRTHGVSHPATGAVMWDQWATLRSRRD